MREIKCVIKKLPPKKSPGSEDFAGKLDQTLKDESIPVLCDLFQDTEEGGMLPHLFCEASAAVMPKPDKVGPGTHKCRPAALTGLDAKQPPKSIGKPNPETQSIITPCDRVGFTPNVHG